MLNVQVESGEASQQFFQSFDHILQMESLTKLQIVFYTPEMCHYFMNSQIVNRNITDLFLSVAPIKNHYRHFIERTSAMFPNVQKLEIQFDREWLNAGNTTKETFEPLNEMKLLEKLVFNKFKSSLMTALKFPLLKHLKVQPLRQSHSTDWNEFFSNNQNIQAIKIDFKLARDYEINSAISLVDAALWNLNHIDDMCIYVGEIGEIDYRDDLTTIVDQSKTIVKSLKVFHGSEQYYSYSSKI